VIDIVERKAVAVLRKADRLVLIDAEGHELETVSAERAKGKLVIGGSGAGKQIKALAALLDAAPALKPQVREAAWVGNRRWNLTFKTAQVLALPEGEEQSRKALVKFAAMDGSNRLLGGKAIAFDMRASERLYIRMPSRVDQPRTEGAAAPATKVAEAGTPAAAKPTPAKQENN
jgi:cell division protein FtsQ